MISHILQFKMKWPISLSKILSKKLIELNPHYNFYRRLSRKIALFFFYAIKIVLISNLWLSLFSSLALLTLMVLFHSLFTQLPPKLLKYKEGVSCERRTLLKESAIKALFVFVNFKMFVIRQKLFGYCLIINANYLKRSNYCRYIFALRKNLRCVIFHPTKLSNNYSLVKSTILTYMRINHTNHKSIFNNVFFRFYDIIEENQAIIIILY